MDVIPEERGEAAANPSWCSDHVPACHSVCGSPGGGPTRGSLPPPDRDAEVEGLSRSRLLVQWALAALQGLPRGWGHSGGKATVGGPRFL